MLAAVTDTQEATSTSPESTVVSILSDDDDFDDYNRTFDPDLDTTGIVVHDPFTEPEALTPTPSPTFPDDVVTPMPVTPAPVAPAAFSMPATPAGSEHRWYVVTVGRQVGVFRGWYVLPIVCYFSLITAFIRNNTAGHVVGVPRATYVRVASEFSANETFNAALTGGQVTVVT
jgi:hypothetical protein